MSGPASAARRPPTPSYPPAGPAVPAPSAGSAAPAWHKESRLPLGALPGAVPCARLHTRHIAREWHLDTLADSAELIVSELVTNALHASWALAEPQPVALRLLGSRDELTVEVWDAQTTPPKPRPHAIDADGGRGLEIVSMLSERWGCYHPGSGGKVVWATLTTVPSGPQPAGP